MKLKLANSIFIISILLSCASEPTPPREVDNYYFINERPIILVHGYGGIDRYRQRFLLYWGGTSDLQYLLRKENWDIRTAQCSPFASNWDRACQLFAFIKGGRVDFGEVHSQNHGHERYGRTYPGIYPEWDSEHPIDILSHSMGGTTSRLLIHLLENGAEEELALGSDDISPLFAGMSGAVNSLTTISSPHNGTTGVLCYRDDIQNSTSKLLRDWFYSQYGKDKIILDVKMDHWRNIIDPELSRKEHDQFLFDFFGGRITKDTALAELTVEGMKKFNEVVQDSENVYYFSWTTRRTETRNGTEVIPLGFSNLLKELGSFMISDECRENYGDEWVPNDGVVNTISMKGPFNSLYIPKEEAPQRGTWQVLGEMNNIDHWEIIGWNNSDLTFPEGYYNLTSWYEDQLWFINDLPD